MGPESWKDERPGAGAESGEASDDAARREAERQAADAREEEGYSQPESSAQKGPTPPEE